MKASSHRNRHALGCVLSIAGLCVWLALPNLQSEQANSAGAGTGAGPSPTQKSSAALPSDKQAALTKLVGQLTAGEPFSEEEASLLRRFTAGDTLTDLEANTVISRALYDYYINNRELTREQSVLFDEYLRSRAQRTKDVLDLKTRLRNRRAAAAAAAAGVLSAPLVAPPNDTCAGAEVIPGAGPFPILTSVTADITGATTTGDPPLPSCNTNVARSIWYKFTPTATALYTISSCADAPTGTTVDDTVMAIYTSTGGCAGPFTEIPTSGPSVGCGDDECITEALQAVITTQLTGGTTYYIVVWHDSNSPPTAGNTAVQLRVSQVAPPVNDTCAGAIALSLFTPVTGTTVSALNDYQLSGSACFTGVGQTASTAAGRDVVYSFTAPLAGNYSFRVNNVASTSDLVLYAASTCPSGSAPVTVTTCLAAANRNPTSPAEEILCLPLTSGQQIFLFVDEKTFSNGSTFVIEATRCTSESEPNNTPAMAGPFVQSIEGSINGAGDVDFYSLGTLAAGSRVFAMVDGVAANTTDFDLRVTTTTDTLAYDDASNDAPFGGLAPNIAGAPATGTPTFLRVNEFSGTLLTEPYRVYAAVQPPGSGPGGTSATTETEPNDTTAQANSAANMFFYGTLSGVAPSTDVDVYSFTAQAGSLIFLSLDGDPLRDNTPIDGKLELLNSAGAVLLVVNDNHSASSTASGVGSLTSMTPNSPSEALVYRVTTSGTYFARVSIGTSSPSSIGAGDYLLSISTNSPTAVTFGNDDAADASAMHYSNGTAIRWRTGYEVQNLGFNVYREDGGTRTRVNSQLIAGSALTVGNMTVLGAGRSYSYFDPALRSGSAYWIEAISLDGQSSWHGPIAVGRSGARIEDTAASPTLGDLNRVNDNRLGAVEARTALVERRAGIESLTAASMALQANIAGQPAVKLTVTAEGFYRVLLSDLAATGFNPSDVGSLQLYVDGRPVPIAVNTKSSSPAIEFYGIGIDSAVTNKHVYWLVAGSQAGQRIQQVAAPGSGTSGGSFLYSNELRPRSIYFSSLRNGDKENFFGPVISRAAVDQTITLPHVAQGNVPGAQLEVALQGVTLAGHRIEVQLNGIHIGEVDFSNQDPGVARLPVAQSSLKEGANIIRLVPLSGTSDISLVDYVRISYWHGMVADGNEIRFTAAAKQPISVDGFSSPAIRVLDVTDPNSAQELLGSVKATKTGYAISLNVPGAGTRTLVALCDDRARKPVGVTLDSPSNWRQPGQAANYVIITQRDLIPAFAVLKTLRQNEGYTVALVDIEDIYDEFSFGQKTPQAVKDFLAYADAKWQTPPRYVMLGGDASYDAKNYLGFGDWDLVPTKLLDTQLMETASDDWFADFNGDGLAEMAVGRLPARSLAEATAMVAKIVNYGLEVPSASALLVADDNSGDASFEPASNELRGLIPASQHVEQINRGDLDPFAAKMQLLDALNRGQRIVNYFGHATVDGWRGGLLTGGDAPALTNSGNLSFFVMMTCLNGYFQDPALDSLAESLIKAKGGAVAVWASTGMTSPGDQSLMDSEMFRRLFDQGDGLATGPSAAGSFPVGPATIGEAVLRAKSVVSNSDVRRTWVLLGDPGNETTLEGCIPL